jgi:hypothetical protein
MAWRLHDYIHLNLTNIRLSDLQSYENPLKMLDALVDENKQIRIITFSPQTYVVWEDFEQIVRKDNRCVATFKQVKEFVETCFHNHYEKSSYDFDIDEILACVSEIETPDDTIVTIEFED